jgi:hypothetical protein
VINLLARSSSELLILVDLSVRHVCLALRLMTGAESSVRDRRNRVDRSGAASLELL